MKLILPVLFVSINLWFGSCRAMTCLTECPKVCNCNSIKDDRCEVICTNQHLDAIPTRFPVEATMIDFSDNDLHTIPAKYFMNLTRLHILRFDNNQLSSLHKDAFKGLTSLRELSLEHNKLFLNNQTFTQYLFSDLTKLKVLKLRHNHIRNGDYIEQAVSVLSALEDLQIVIFNNTLFGPAYRNLTLLKNLTLSYGLEKMFIPEKTFENVPFLTFLNLSNCSIANIHKNTFSYLTLLAVLDMSFNTGFSFHNVGIAFYGIRNSTSLQYLDISSVTSKYETLLQIEDIVNLQNTNLSILIMSGNHLQFIEDLAFSFLPKTLKYISLSYNSLGHRIGHGSTFDEINRLSNIVVLDLSFNNICPISFLTNLSHLDNLNLSKNNCRMLFYFNSFVHSNLKILYINRNILGLSNDAKENAFNITFQNLTLLEELNISDNRIEEIANSSLINSPNITSLDLSNNLLKTFSLTISHMTNLSRLDLSHNSLQELSENTRHDIELVSKRHRLIVDLSMNDIQCTCQHLSFIRWLVKVSKSKSTLVISTKCTLPNDTVTSLEGNNIFKIHEYLEKYCFSWFTIIMVAVGLIMAFISLLTTALVYRFRWNLRYFYYMAKQRYSRVPNGTDDYLFDAFVVYADEDQNFVLRYLIPELEECNNFKLNIHHRDFMVGNLIIENILEAIQKSRKCLILLSRHLLNSDWCLYEFNMAKMESMYSNRDVVVIVMLEDIAESSMPLQVLHHIKTHSYIEFPAEDQEGQLVFWDNLKRSL